MKKAARIRDRQATGLTNRSARQVSKAVQAEPTGPLDRFARWLVLRTLARLEFGEIVLCEGSRKHSFGNATPEFPHRARIVVADATFFRAVAFGGTVGSGESWIRGAWHCDDLTALISAVAGDRSRSG